MPKRSKNRNRRKVGGAKPRPQEAENRIERGNVNSLMEFPNLAGSDFRSEGSEPTPRAAF
jgi:hypothetical protein